MYTDLATIAIFAFLFSAIAGRVERSAVSGPIIFIVFGLIGGPVGLGFLDIDIDTVELRVLVDMTLALVLFSDAANADLRVLRTYSTIPIRMLLVGLPLCIALGVGFGVVIFPDISVYELCLLATMLAATDAALGKAVVTNKLVPERLRQALNAESGLNDGLCVPVLLLFLALAGAGHDGGAGHGGERDSATLALQLVLREIGIGVAVAVVLVPLGIRVLSFAVQRNWITEIWRQIPVVTLSLACFTTAQSLHGSGYIAAFVGGLLFGYLAKDRTHHLVMAAEGIAELLAMMTWVIFGAVVVGQSWSGMTPQVVLYSLLSLTVIRMLPMVLCLTGTGEKLEARLFLAWFGPRGLASIVFFVIVSAANLPAESVLMHVVVCTITLCVVFHGITANPWARGIAGRLKAE